jgi:uncharacterized protein
MDGARSVVEWIHLSVASDMPLITDTSYTAPFWLPGGHLQTIYPALFGKTADVPAQVERLELADGDFLELAWSGQSGRRLAILTHGLEADMQTPYIQRMAAALLCRGWDVLRWNLRGCGRTPNRQLRLYHSGATDDLHAVVCHAIDRHPAQSMDLVGFSLGGNLVLKYLGERCGDLPARLHRAVAFSVPCDLACSSRQLAKCANRIYMHRFLKTLRAKLRVKKQQFPDALDLTGLERIRSFKDFDDRYTAPLHGFHDAQDYWKQSSCRRFLATITLPTLLVNAANDPFLGPDCHPWKEARCSDFFHFELPATGGHVGFPAHDRNGEYWSEKRAAVFLSQT